MGEIKRKNKKVKVEYDVEDPREGKDKAKTKTKKAYGKISKKNIFRYVFLLVFEAVFYYFATPAINIHRPGFWVWLAITLAAICICSLDVTESQIVELAHNKKVDGVTPVAKYTFFGAVLLFKAAE